MPKNIKTNINVVGADADQSLIKNHKYFRQDNYKTSFSHHPRSNLCDITHTQILYSFQYMLTFTQNYI